MSEAEVVVVGAGPTGLALSLALARHGVPSVVLDSGDGRVTARAARTCVLRPDTAAWLPLGSRPGELWTPWSRWRTRRRRQGVQDVELGPGASPVHVEQHVLERRLRAALEHEALARVVTGSHLDLLEQDADGITAHTRPRGLTSGGGDAGAAGGGAGGGRAGGTWWRGSYLVGCDGARSTVRKLLGVRFPGRTAVERHAVAALRVRLPWEGEALLDRDAGGEPGEVLARPLRDGVWRLDWLLPPRGDLVTPEQLLDMVHETLSRWYETEGGAGGGAAMGAYELLDTGVHTAHQRLARQWRVGRAFLAGDAAHQVGALGIQSVEEGLRDAANLAWKLAVVWHGADGTAAGAGRGGDRSLDPAAAEAVLDSYEAERRTAVGARLRAVDQVLPLVRREGGGLRALLPGGSGRARLEVLTGGHLGRGSLGGPAVYGRSPLAPPREAVATVPVGTPPGAPVQDVPVVALDGEQGRLWEQLGGVGGEMLVLLVAPGTGVWDSRHWLSAGMMPELAATVAALPIRAKLLVTESYPDAAAHTVLVIRPDGHLVAALPGPRTSGLRACADALRGSSLVGGPATTDARGR